MKIPLGEGARRAFLRQRLRFGAQERLEDLEAGRSRIEHLGRPQEGVDRIARFNIRVAMEPWAARNAPSMPEVQSPPSGRGSNAVEPTPPPPLIIVTFIEPGVIDQRHCIGPCDGGDT